MKSLTRADQTLILKYCKKGLNSNQIMEKVPGYTRQQIAAVLAWKTMAGYKGKTEAILESHKIAIINLIRKKNMQTSEIMKKFSYSRQQIAAVRAWMTMGAY